MLFPIKCTKKVSIPTLSIIPIQQKIIEYNELLEILRKRHSLNRNPIYVLVTTEINLVIVKNKQKPFIGRSRLNI